MKDREKVDSSVRCRAELSRPRQHMLATELTPAHCKLSEKLHFPQTKSSRALVSALIPSFFPAHQLAKLHGILAPLRLCPCVKRTLLHTGLKCISLTPTHTVPCYFLAICPLIAFLGLFLPQCITDALRARGINVSTSLPDDVLDFVRRHPLMSQEVQPSDKRPLLFRRSTDYTHMAVHMTQGLDGQTYHVLYMGTGEHGVTYE